MKFESSPFVGTQRGELWSKDEREAFERLPDSALSPLLVFNSLMPSEVEGAIKESAIGVERERRRKVVVATASTQDVAIGGLLAVDAGWDPGRS